MLEDIDEGTALGHATSDGHVCGPEESLRMFARATLRTTGADEVFVEPEYTFIRHGNTVVRAKNGAAMREALDSYLLTGELPETGVAYELESPLDG